MSESIHPTAEPGDGKRAVGALVALTLSPVTCGVLGSPDIPLPLPVKAVLAVLPPAVGILLFAEGTLEARRARNRS